MQDVTVHLRQQFVPEIRGTDSRCAQSTRAVCLLLFLFPGLGGCRSVPGSAELESSAANDVTAVMLQDFQALPGDSWRETRRMLSDPVNVGILATGLGTAIGLRGTVDDRVREESAAHPERWGSFSREFGRLGEAPVQVPILLALYGWSVSNDDPRMHSTMQTMLDAYTITGLGTLAVKGISNTSRPSTDWNNGRYGFPSFHAASSFCIAAVLEETQGLQVGLPAYVAAGLIGWTRIDERDHDLSDIVFGAVLGTVIGKSVAGQRLRNDPRFQLGTFHDAPTGCTGLQIELNY